MLNRRSFVGLMASALAAPAPTRHVSDEASPLPEDRVAALRRAALSPRQFGCRGDGVSDDTLNFRKAVAAAGQSNRPLDVSGATYLLRLQPGQTSANAIIPLNAARFAMIGDREANIKIADDCGNYTAIFAPTAFTIVQSWQFIDVGFDKNSSGNVIDNREIAKLTPGRYAVYLMAHAYVSGEALFQSCLFEDTDATVDIYLPEPLGSGGRTVSNPALAPTRDANRLIKVIGCDWRNARLGGTPVAGRWPDHDQSFVNFGAETGVVIGNSFEGQSWAQAPTTAIETRCSHLLVSGNSIRRFQIGMNITVGYRHSAAVDREQIVTGNMIETSRRGISWWPIASPSTRGGRLGGSGLRISENVIHHRWDKYAQSLPQLTGIWTFLTDAALEVDEVTISGNRIVYAAGSGTDAMARPRQPATDAAIGWLTSPGSINWKVRRLNIAGNKISLSPCSAIGTTQGIVDRLGISNNEFVGCAQTAANIPAHYRAIVRFTETRFAPNGEAIIRGNYADTTPGAKPDSYFRLDPADRVPAGVAIHMANNVLADPGGRVKRLVTNTNLGQSIRSENGPVQLRN